MFLRPKVIRCSHCKRLFSDMADRCPECHTKTPRGWISAVLPIVCIVIAIVILAWTIHAVMNRPEPSP